MESPKYLIVITLVEGQNFTLPDCVLDKTATATVFAEARFENEPLRSDPVKLTTANPEFLTELAWQVDRRSLHHFKVERRAIKLQVFMQTKPTRKAQGTCYSSTDTRTQQQQQFYCSNTGSSAGSSGFGRSADSGASPPPHTTKMPPSDEISSVDDNETSPPTTAWHTTTNQIQLVGYTIIDIRTAQEKMQPKLEWRPLLNPKFKQPSYNRPEIQLALSLVRCDELDGSQSILSSETVVDQSRAILSPSSYLAPNSIDFQSNDDYELGPSSIIENQNSFLNGYNHQDLQFSTDDDCDTNEVSTNQAFNQTNYKSTLDQSILSQDLYKNTMMSAKSNVDRFTRLIQNNDDSNGRDDYQLRVGVFNNQQNKIGKNQTHTYDVHNNRSNDIGTITPISSGVKEHSNNASSINDDDHYKTCLDQTINLVSFSSNTSTVQCQNQKHNEQYYDNDISIRLINGYHYIYDALDEHKKSSIDQCNQLYFIDISIAFTNSLDKILSRRRTFNERRRAIDDRVPIRPNILSMSTQYYFSFTLFGTRVKSNKFDLYNANLEPKCANFRVATTNAQVLETYFKLNPTLDVKLHNYQQDECVGFASVQLDQLVLSSCTPPPSCTDVNDSTIDKSTRSIEGIYSLMRACIEDDGDDCLDGDDLGGPTIGVAIEISSSSAPVPPPAANFDSGSPVKTIKDVRESNEHQTTSLVNAVISDDNQNKIQDQSRTQTEIDRLLGEASQEIESWKERQLRTFHEKLCHKESQYLTDLMRQIEIKETKRDAEIRRKIDELNRLERKLKLALTSVENREKQLELRDKQLTQRDQQITNKLEMLDVEIAKAIDSVKNVNILSRASSIQSETSNVSHARSANASTSPPAGSSTDSKGTNSISANSPKLNRRLSLRQSTGGSSSTGIPCGILRPSRSSSLARGSYEINGKIPPRTKKIANGVDSSAIDSFQAQSKLQSTAHGHIQNKIASRPSSQNLGKTTQERLIRLRKERADLLRKGCRSNDKVIVEINTLIEKLVKTTS